MGAHQRLQITLSGYKAGHKSCIGQCGTVQYCSKLTDCPMQYCTDRVCSEYYCSGTPYCSSDDRSYLLLLYTPPFLCLASRGEILATERTYKPTLPARSSNPPAGWIDFSLGRDLHWSKSFSRFYNTHRHGFFMSQEERAARPHYSDVW